MAVHQKAGKFAICELPLARSELLTYTGFSVWVMELCYRQGGSPSVKVIRLLPSDPTSWLAVPRGVAHGRGRGHAGG